jgi:D-alanyl-D-alanine carboxypeptidase
VWKGRRIGNHDRLLGRVQGVDGIKTGYTRASGFNLVTSVMRNNRMVVAVVLGGDTGRQRDQRMASLLETYIPQASTGKRTAAAIPGYAKATVAVAAASVMPTPVLAPPPAASSPAAAEVAVAEPMPAPIRRPEQVAVAAAPAAPAASAPANAAPAPDSMASLLAGAYSIFALDAVEQGDTSDDDDETSSIVAPTTKAASGWKIQLAASPSQSQAEDILDRALGQAARVLRDASPYTEPVVSGNTKLYRARFAGFHDKAAARAACAYLSKRDFKCLTISD